MITSEQIRAARALLRIEQADLARRAHLSAATVRRLEAFKGVEQVSASTLREVQRALEEAGAEFIDEGVRHRRAQAGAKTEERFANIMAIARRSAARTAMNPNFTENDLYDDDGLPA